MRYKFLDHTADIKFQAFGKDIHEAFSNSAMALTNIMCKEEIKPIKEIKIMAKGRDLKSLLSDFLEKILFYLEVDSFLLSEVKEIKLIGVGSGLKKRTYKLNSILIGDDVKNYEIQSHVKAITYNEMEIKQEPLKCMIQVVVDV